MKLLQKADLTDGGGDCWMCSRVCSAIHQGDILVCMGKMAQFYTSVLKCCKKYVQGKMIYFLKVVFNVQVVKFILEGVYEF